MRRRPEIDPTTIGISFVDILFALVVGRVLEPIGKWAEDPRAQSLPTVRVTHLTVALVLTITSWIGYHNSANRARFKLRFLNVELFKFTLDIVMVVIYFLVASYALHTPIGPRPETLLVFIAFALYLLWDLAGAWQKRARPNNEYKLVWEEVLANPSRPDIVEEWKPTNWRRVGVTVLGLVSSGTLFVVVWLGFSGPTVTSKTSFVVDAILLTILVLYRVLKDWKRKEPESTTGSTRPSRTAMVSFGLLLVAIGLLMSRSPDERR